MTRLLELDKGCRGHQVQMLQHLLNTTREVRPPLDLDGLFGSMTDRAVRRYQEGRSLKVDGIVGAQTWRSLGVNDGVAPKPRTPVAGEGGRAGASSRASSVGSSATPTRAVPVASVRKLAALSAPAPVAGARSTPAPAPSRATTPPRAPATPRRSPPLEPPGTAIGAPWMRIALAEDGVHEIAGRQHTKRILEYHRATSLGAQTDEVPWCSSFVNWCLKQVGISGTNSALAASWRTWGTSLETPRYGCIVQIRQKGGGADAATGSSTGNHVAFFIRGTATSVTLLGGNQRNSVRQSTYPLRSYEIKALKWPTGR